MERREFLKKIKELGNSGPTREPGVSYDNDTARYIDQRDPDQGYEPMSREKFLMLFATAATGLFVADVLKNALDGYDTDHLGSRYSSSEKWRIGNFLEKRGQEIKEMRLAETIEKVENLPLLQDVFLQTGIHTPGGYRGPYQNASRADRIRYGNEALGHNYGGRDRRSLLEMQAVLVFAKYSNQDRVVAEIASQIQESIKSGVQKGLYTQVEAIGMLGEFKSETLDQIKDPITKGDLFLLSHIITSRQGRLFANALLREALSAGKGFVLPELDDDEVELLIATRGIDRHPVSKDSLRWAKAIQPVIEFMLVATPEIWFENVPADIREQAMKNPGYGQAAIDAFFTDNEFSDISYDAVMGVVEGRVTNPGFIAKFKAWETANDITVGDAPFMSQTNTQRDRWPDSENAIKRVAKQMEEQLKIPYLATFPRGEMTRQIYQYIPGSLRRNFDSGGAVYGQFMPRWLEIFYNKYNASRDLIAQRFRVNLPPLQPGSPWATTLLMGLYLNGFSPQRTNPGNKTVPNYDPIGTRFKGGATLSQETVNQIHRSGHSPQHYAAASWNPFGLEIRSVIDFGKRYEQI